MTKRRSRAFFSLSKRWSRYRNHQPPESWRWLLNRPSERMLIFLLMLSVLAPTFRRA